MVKRDYHASLVIYGLGKTVSREYVAKWLIEQGKKLKAKVGQNYSPTRFTAKLMN